jgi:hypothetical protein
MAMVLVEGGDQLPSLVGQYNETTDSGTSGSTQLTAGHRSRSAILGAIVLGVMMLRYS